MLVCLSMFVSSETVHPEVALTLFMCLTQIFVKIFSGFVFG